MIATESGVGDRDREQLAPLLLGGVLDTHACYSELQSLVVGWRGEGAAREVVAGSALGATLGHEPWSPGFVQGGALMKQGSSW